MIKRNIEPLPITLLSKAGFGTYRLEDRLDHHKALLYAIENGCNLIDTASTYSQGKSEIVIGEVLKKKPKLKTFIVSKAGYVNKTNIEDLRLLNAKGFAKNDIVNVNDDFLHSINPYFLNTQLNNSLIKIGINCLDVFLLHNPEYYFNQKKEVSENEFYCRLEEAFCWLETQVDLGRIRYYGISSNTFPLVTEHPNTLNLSRIFSIAQKISINHHFKFIQFPFNLFEQGALQLNQDGESLIEKANRFGVITLGNRPLNANTKFGPIRIASYAVDKEVAPHILENIESLVIVMRRAFKKLDIDIKVSPAKAGLIGDRLL